MYKIFAAALSTALLAATFVAVPAKSASAQYHRHHVGYRGHVGRHHLGHRHVGYRSVGYRHLGHHYSHYALSRNRYLTPSYRINHHYRSPLSYTYRYNRYPSYYGGYSSLHYGRVISPYYRRGPSSVSLYFSSLPYYRPSFYYHSYRVYPFGRTYYYDPTLCYPYSYSSYRSYGGVYLSSTTTKASTPTLLVPPPRVTTGDSLLTSFASTTIPSTAAMDTSLASRTTASLERLRMSRHTTTGDAYFAAGRYLEAIDSYATAIEDHPLESEGLFRLGHALVAAGQYDTAVRSFKAALGLKPDLGRESFRLNDLYGSAAADKNTHMEALAKYAMENPRNANALFLVGMFLHYDGQAARAHRFFDRAARIDMRSDHIRKMLDATSLTET